MTLIFYSFYCLIDKYEPFIMMVWLQQLYSRIYIRDIDRKTFPIFEISGKIPLK